MIILPLNSTTSNTMSFFEVHTNHLSNKRHTTLLIGFRIIILKNTHTQNRTVTNWPQLSSCLLPPMSRFYPSFSPTFKGPSTPPQLWNGHLTYELFTVLVWYYLFITLGFSEIFLKEKIYFYLFFITHSVSWYSVFDEWTINERLKV